MTLNSTVRARVDSDLKSEVEVILKKIGLNTSQAINIFLNSVKNNNGIPFELKIPNETTINAIKEADNGDGVTVSFDEFLKETNNA
ncbi:MAG TPA: type II toxin-antitoxin system RelB/DinJ family antitoxin [Sulfurospirillum arcachonense]|nr:type II toxin-antitoxin system RelB/DinJ family antitoxin [Sulfurospirillum arcachonense]